MIHLFYIRKQSKFVGTISFCIFVKYKKNKK